jgi:hypothetical protein
MKAEDGTDSVASVRYPVSTAGNRRMVKLLAL